MSQYGRFKSNSNSSNFTFSSTSNFSSQNSNLNMLNDSSSNDKTNNYFHQYVPKISNNSSITSPIQSRPILPKITLPNNTNTSNSKTSQTLNSPNTLHPPNTLNSPNTLNPPNIPKFNISTRLNSPNILNSSNTSDISNSSPTISNTQPSSNINPDAYLEELDICKKQIKSVRQFDEGVDKFIKLMEKYLDSSNKHKFYGSLLSVSHLVGKNGYSLETAQKLYKAALGDKCISKWSSGFLSNIREWSSIVDKMINGTWNPSEYTKKDGRFGTQRVIIPTVRSTTTTSNTLRDELRHNNNSIPNFANSMISQSFFDLLFGGRGSMFASSDDSDDSDDSNDFQNSSSNPFYSFEPSPSLLPPFSIGHSEKTITQVKQFVVSQNIFDSIQSKDDKPSSLRIHCMIFPKGSSTSTKCPDYVSMYVNGYNKVPCNVAGKAVKFGFDITSLCKKGINHLTISSTSCCCNLEYGIKLVRNNFENIKDKISQSILTKTESLEAIKKSFASQGDIMELHITIGLLCPLGQMFIEIPVRSKKCSHIQCFDLETFLLMNKSNPDWECPVCNKRAYIDDLIVDEYMKEILETVGDEEIGDSIKLQENGKWELFNIEFGDHSESESDNEDNNSSLLKKRPIPKNIPIAKPPPKIMRTLAPPPKTVVIDLT